MLFLSVRNYIQVRNGAGKSVEAAQEAYYNTFSSTTTLLSLLITKTFVFAFQIGDGDIVLVDKDSISPVVETEKILGTETHSLSMIDAWKSAVSVIRRRNEETGTPYPYMLSTDGFVKIRREPEARIALCKCKETKKIYDVRMEKAAKREGYDAAILKGNIGWTPEYNGCPYCGTISFTVCGTCKKLNFQTPTGQYFTCEWCGSSGWLTDYDCAGVMSGGDR